MLWLYHNVDLERKKPTISFLIIERSLFAKPCVSFNQGCFVPSLVEIGQMFLDKKIFNFGNDGPSFEQIWITFTLGWFVASLVEIDPVVLEKIFRFCQHILAFS